MIASRLVILLLASLVLAGCSHNAHRAQAEAAYYNAQAAAASDRQPIVELVARPGEAIVLQGVERFAVYAPEHGQAIQQYQGGPTFAETAAGIVRDAGPLFLGYSGYRALERLGTAAIDRAGGNTHISNSGRMASPGDTAGGDLIHGDRIDNRGRMGSPGHDGNQGRIGSDGDEIGGDRIDNRGRWHSPGDNRDASPGPIDQGGDCRDGADCSTEPPGGD